MGTRFVFSRTLQSLILLAILAAHSGFGQESGILKIEELCFKTFRIENPAIIDSVLTEVMLPNEGVVAIEIIDLNGNGVDRCDVLRLTVDRNRGKDEDTVPKSYFNYQIYCLSDIGISAELLRRF